MSSMSAWFVMHFVFPLCIFKPTFRLSEFRLFRCFSICFVVSLKRATSSANLKLARFSPSTLTHSEMSAFLNTSSMTAMNNLGESGSPCQTMGLSFPYGQEFSTFLKLLVSPSPITLV